MSFTVTLVSLINEHAVTNSFMAIFQPARPFLLHKNEQGGHCYLIPCSFIRDTRVWKMIMDHLLNKPYVNGVQWLPFEN